MPRRKKSKAIIAQSKALAGEKKTSAAVKPSRELPLGELLLAAKAFSQKNMKLKWSEVSDDDESFLEQKKAVEAKGNPKGVDDSTKALVPPGLLAGEPDLSDASIALMRAAMRNLFKSDHPYRTKLGLFTSLQTSSAGVVNLQLNVSSIGSTQEWTSIDALFDEFFVHSVTVRYEPRNVLGGGVGNYNAATAAGTPVDLSLATTNNQVVNSGLMGVSLFHAAGFYTTAAGMLSNPTKKTMHTCKPWVYVWRNNDRFDPHGTAMSSGTTEAWQGWTLILNSNNYGGAIQVRTYGDVVLGDQAHALTTGDIAEIWDVSFRCRA